ncbi:transporter [Alginatibacterium sediminis]|uniref:Transporter n=1 Tax=Alginatibacterium sediminis TaxID=2164068 RepID=A0A420EBS2_9ALTE|nr:transporter [Alginatibacterium sediminis]RKF18093.1 transporter [Alginatibacterium sediminis]
MHSIDLWVVAAYFVFVIGAAITFKRFATDSGQYIKGGGAMMWWMAGATAFMTQFSAWTFTGAAAKAYEDGFPVLMLFWGNALGFFIAAWFFAERFRKLRVDTPMDVIRQRFGLVSEQIYTWLQFPLTTLSAAIWLNGLAIFVAAVFQIELSHTIIGVGVLVTFIAVSGGSWTVSATNVIQLILLMAITMTIGIVALIGAGGPIELARNFPAPSLAGNNVSYPQIFILWGAVVLTKQSISTNNAMSCYRFLVTTNEREAKKAAFITGLMFLIGPVLWFVPPWVSATMNIDLASLYPNLGSEANNAAYLYFVDTFMPAGVLGLVLAAMIAATISPMTTALNRNAGIFVRNVYQVFWTNSEDEKRKMWVAKAATLVNGILATAAALFFASLESVGFFDLMMLFGALLQVPLAIPALLAVVVLKTPDWSGWATLVVGLLVSCIVHFGFDVSWYSFWFETELLTAREQVDLKVITALLLQVLVTGGFFLSTQLFYKEPKSKRRLSLNQFESNMLTPISLEEQATVDGRQNQYLARMVRMLSACCLLLTLGCDSIRDALIFVAISTLMLLASLVLSKKETSAKLEIAH